MRNTHSHVEVAQERRKEKKAAVPLHYPSSFSTLSSITPKSKQKLHKTALFLFFLLFYWCTFLSSFLDSVFSLIFFVFRLRMMKEQQVKRTATATKVTKARASEQQNKNKKQKQMQLTTAYALALPLFPLSFASFL
jgi:Ca2+/Na+ antiporter